MDMILLDWTRMGKCYCLAGVVAERGEYRVVRPLPGRTRSAAVRNAGWSPFLMEGHTRWEMFELMKPEPAPPQAPHLEDSWVASLRPRRCLASLAQRRAILQATTATTGAALFGAPLMATRAGGFVNPGTGQRSLTTIVVPSGEIDFAGSWRAGALEPDLRVCLDVPDFGRRQLPVKDHFLLSWASQAGALDKQIEALNHGVRQMGDQVAVRLGLSRAFRTRDGEPGACWLMADGFFSLSEPQP